jgi:hypothetical protein
MVFIVATFDTVQDVTQFPVNEIIQDLFGSRLCLEPFRQFVEFFSYLLVHDFVNFRKDTYKLEKAVKQNYLTARNKTRYGTNCDF